VRREWETSLMTKFIALLRAVNLGGNGKLATAVNLSW
jgi:hypothetical protein